uniref:CCHC-type domain-containing protein n=1 Tax=Lactuca sativa TaxID=4236 RepID=A0A9R1VMF5_LACSA|nr:hypothetical protein LSAT_V11C500266000 [Lactuca sativa]
MKILKSSGTLLEYPILHSPQLYPRLVTMASSSSISSKRVRTLWNENNIGRKSRLCPNSMMKMKRRNLVAILELDKLKWKLFTHKVVLFVFNVNKPLIHIFPIRPRMEDYLNGIDEELWNCINGTVQAPANVQSIGSFATSTEVAEQQNRLKKNEKRCMRELRSALPPVVYNYIRSCKTAEIWITLKEKYQGSEKTKINSVKQCLVELKEFRQKDTETLENYYDRLNELVFRCNRYGIMRSLMEFNLTFIMGLRKEWRSVSMMIKNQQSFDTTSLNNLYNQLKTHESEVLEMFEESKQSLGGPLALVSKISEVEINETNGSDNEGFLMNSDDEAVAFYSNNKVKNFFKKPFNPKGKANDAKSGVAKAGGEEKKKLEKNDEKQKDAKDVKKLKGDSGIYCHYCNGANHFAADCMLRKKEEKKSKVKDEAYYSEKIEELRAKTKGMSLVSKGEYDEGESGTYQIWSSGSDDEEMRHPTHGAMFASFEENCEEDVSGRCFVSKSTDKSPTTTKVRAILESFNIPLSAYDAGITSFDDTVAYFDSVIVSASTEAQNLNMQLVETRRELENKRSRVDKLELLMQNVKCDRNNLEKEVRLLLAQRNIYCNSAKHLYAKLTALHHLSEISKEQHRKLLPFLEYECEKVVVVSNDCENTIAQFDKIPDDRFAYGIVKIDEFLNADELVSIVNESLTKNEQVKILKKTKTSTLDSQFNYADVNDNSDNVSEISEIEKEEEVDCSQLSIINITSKIKSKEIIVDSIVKDENDIPSTSQHCNFDNVEVESWKTDDTDENKEDVKDSHETPQRVVVDQVFGDTKEFDKILNDKGAHYLETNTVVYPNFTCTNNTIFPNQVFVTNGNVEKIKPEFNKMVENDNKRSTTEGFFANQNTVENNLTQNSYVFQRQKSSQKWVVKGEKENKIFERVEKPKIEMKLISHKFKLMVGNYSTENNVSKRKARKSIFWQVVSNNKPKVEKTQISKSKSSKFQRRYKQKDTSFHNPINSVDKIPMQNNDKFVRKYNNNRKFETSQKFVNDQKFHNVGKLTNNSSTLNVKTQTKMKFSPKQPNFPNPSVSKPTKVSYTKGKSDVCTINRWLEGKERHIKMGSFQRNK